MAMKRLLLIGAVALALAAVAVGNLLAADPLQPTAADASRAAAEEFKVLPPGVVQVDCRPGLSTFPPFTSFSGLPGGTFYILADGRCFQDVSWTPAPPVIVSTPADATH